MEKKEIFVLILMITIFILILGKYFNNSGQTIKEISQEWGYFKYELKYQSLNDNINITKENAKFVPVLVYHGIWEEPYKDDVTLEKFENQMKSLKENGYQTISLEDFHAFMKNEKELPEKSFLLTFDDGIKSSYYNTDPILKALNYNAVMFIITKYSLSEGTNYYLSLEELKKMLETGRWEIQAHAKDSHENIIINANGDRNHFLSNRMWLEDKKRLETKYEYQDRIRKEFVDTKKEIEDTLGVKVIAFAFPFNDFGTHSNNFENASYYIIEEVKDTYSFASFYQYWLEDKTYLNFPDEKSFLMKRVKVENNWSGQKLVNMLKEESDKYETIQLN